MYRALLTVLGSSNLFKKIK